MARGQIAKQNVTDIIQKAFGNDFVGIQDNKLYVRADDGGTKVQIAISMTCPKVELAAAPVEAIQEDWDFSDLEPAKPQPQKFEPTVNEQENMAKLLERLGL